MDALTVRASSSIRVVETFHARICVACVRQPKWKLRFTKALGRLHGRAQGHGRESRREAAREFSAARPVHARACSCMHG
eukprot:4819968-Pleurochrysis_carterae.AAC.3